MGTQLNFSATYHQETDGKTKILNQVLEDMLRMHVLDQQNQWEKYLPYEILYGRPNRTQLS